MKKLLVLPLLLLLLLLSACANTAVSYRLSEDNNVSIDYRVEIMPDGETISNYTSKIINYWNNMDFQTNTTESDDTTTLTGTKTTGYNNMEEAAQALSEIFAAEDSLFYDVEFQYTPSYFQDRFQPGKPRYRLRTCFATMRIRACPPLKRRHCSKRQPKVSIRSPLRCRARWSPPTRMRRTDRCVRGI